MAPDIQQLHRIRASAAKAGLLLRDVSADTFATNYRPRRYRQFEWPPSFIWLCTICQPGQLARVWINVAGPDDLGALDTLNDESRAGPVPWPDELIVFGLTGDESFCFAYNRPDAEPAVVTVDSYAPHHDENDAEYVSWSWYADDFDKWLAAQADWLPKADAQSRAWNAQFEARTNAKARDKPAPRGRRKPGDPRRDLREQARRREND